jgi:hypothetical protein
MSYGKWQGQGEGEPKKGAKKVSGPGPWAAFFFLLLRGTNHVEARQKQKI